MRDAADGVPITGGEPGTEERARPAPLVNRLDR
jgi:hypothetical protein